MKDKDILDLFDDYKHKSFPTPIAFVFKQS